MAGKKGRRAPNIPLTDEHRVKIANSNILNALIEHVNGKREMSSTQVTAGVALLKKCLPDLASVEHKGEMDINAAITFNTVYEDVRKTNG